MDIVKVLIISASFSFIYTVTIMVVSWEFKKEVTLPFSFDVFYDSALISFQTQLFLIIIDVSTGLSIYNFLGAIGLTYIYFILPIVLGWLMLWLNKIKKVS
jgi:hypothetical protein